MGCCLILVYSLLLCCLFVFVCWFGYVLFWLTLFCWVWGCFILIVLRLFCYVVCLLKCFMVNSKLLYVLEFDCFYYYCVRFNVVFLVFEWLFVLVSFGLGVCLACGSFCGFDHCCYGILVFVVWLNCFMVCLMGAHCWLFFGFGF